MALGTATAIGLGLGVLGGYMNARSQNAAARQQNRFNQQMFGQAMGMMQNDPSQLEGMGLNFFNSGQDGLMQMLRADPRSKVDQTLQGIAQGNTGFDNSQLFQALGLMDQQALDESVGGLRAGAPGLGQRFGTAMRGAEVDLRADAANQAAVRNAQIGMQSHEAAQARAMQALGLLSGREQFNIESMLQGRGQQAGILQLLLAAEAQRRQGNVGLLQAAGGMGQPVAQPGYGGFLSGIGTLGLWAGMQRPRQGPTTSPAGGGGGTWTPWPIY